MANWAYTSYVVSGPKEVLEKIEKAIISHPVSKGADEHWEGDILNALGAEWVSRDRDREKGLYMRGFINEKPWWSGDDLRFWAEEAWDITDFDIVLRKEFPEIKVYWAVEEEGMGIYKTNDREGLYFEDKVYVDTCINGDYRSDYFKNTDDAYQWLSEITDGKIKTKKDVEDFNDSISERNPDEFIYVHEYLIIDN
jgi:hypothetical protein